MKRFLYLILSLQSLLLNAQEQSSNALSHTDKTQNHLEIGATVGSVGIGLEATYRFNKSLSLRAGFSAMPRITFNKSYTMSTVDGTSDMTDERMNKLVGYLQDMTSSKNIDKYIEMSHQAKFINAKILVDWHPFKKKEWYFTTGLYIGTKTFAKAINVQEEAPTLFAVNIYNQIYDQAVLKHGQAPDYEYPVISIAGKSYEMDESTTNKILSYGRAGVTLGQYEDGKYHSLSPTEDGVMKAQAESNVVKPYLGFGFEKYIGSDKHWILGFNAGALFWGKTHVYTHDGVCLMHDVSNIRGDVGHYVNLLKKLPVYPNLEIKLAYTIF